MQICQVLDALSIQSYKRGVKSVRDSLITASGHFIFILQLHIAAVCMKRIHLSLACAEVFVMSAVAYH